MGRIQGVFSAAGFALPALDGLRAIAVLLVILFHGFFLGRSWLDANLQSLLIERTERFGSFFWHGDAGVDLFFILSGLLLTRILLREWANSGSVSILNFYRRRVFRIVPAYFALIALGVALGWANHESAWANLLFVNNFLPAEQQYLPWTWSIAVEMQYYALLPLLLPVLIRPGWIPYFVLGSLFLLTGFLKLWILAGNPSLYLTPFHELFLAREPGLGVVQ